MSDIYQSEKIDEIVKALLKVHAEISHALKDKENPHFHSEFASLEAVIDATKSAYLKNDCVVIQMPSIDNSGKPVLITQVLHSSGQWVRSFTPILSKDPSDPQKMGSGLTYARRYGLSAISNIGQTDDDGNHASKNESAYKEDPNDPLSWVWPFDYPNGMKGICIGDLGTDGVMAAGKSLASWKAKAGPNFPKDAQKFMDALRDVLKQPAKGK